MAACDRCSPAWWAITAARPGARRAALASRDRPTDPCRRLRGRPRNSARHAEHPTVGSPTSRPGRRTWLGSGRRRTRVRARVRHRLPDGEAAVLHAPDPVTAVGLETASICSSAGSSSSRRSTAAPLRRLPPRAGRRRTSRPGTLESLHWWGLRIGLERCMCMPRTSGGHPSSVTAHQPSALSGGATPCACHRTSPGPS